jgi:hypothetical protein
MGCFLYSASAYDERSAWRVKDEQENRIRNKEEKKKKISRKKERRKRQ